MNARPEQARNVVNGIDVTALEETIAAIKEDPELAECKFRITNKWVGGTRNHATVGDFFAAKQENGHQQRFEWDSDEPPMLAGNDSAPNPVEHLLNALSACVTTTMVAHAAVRGIKIDELESHLEGDLDLRGFLGLSPQVREGYRNIRITFKVKTDEKNLEQLKELCKMSPVYDVTRNGTRINIAVEAK